MKTITLIKTCFTLLCAICFMSNVNAQATISPNDFMILDNTNWEGTLTYLDYQSNKPTDIETKMQIKITDRTFEQNIQYVWEPNKNVKAKAKINKTGTQLGKQKVVSKINKPDGSLQITTTSKGKDDGKKATFYYIYEFDSDNYKVTKEVQFLGSDERFVRNTYKYTKIN